MNKKRIKELVDKMVEESLLEEANQSTKRDLVFWFLLDLYNMGALRPCSKVD